MATPTVRSIARDAYVEIGVIDPTDELSIPLGNFGLLRFQNQLDAWQADNLTIATPAQQVAYTLPSGTSTVTIGLTGTIATQRPVWITEINYVVPGSSPEVETPMGQMDKDAYAAFTIKALHSQLPTLYYYNPGTPNGTLFFWPQVTQNVKLYLYLQQGVDVPATLDSTVIGPPGYQEAFMYQLALRLCTPLGRTPPPMLPDLAAKAYARMKRPNLMPPLMGMDQALVPVSGNAYNILNDTNTSPSSR